MSIHHLPLTQVNAALLDELVANTVAESRVLDYKERLPGDSDADKRELLADVIPIRQNSLHMSCHRTTLFAILGQLAPRLPQTASCVVLLTRY